MRTTPRGQEPGGAAPAWPVRVTSATSTMVREVVTSTRRPERVATISKPADAAVAGVDQHLDLVSSHTGQPSRSTAEPG
jgi:hypothetical protein